MYVIPKIGSLIPDPALQDFLPVQGREVEKTNYWLRRIKDGDVTRGTPAKTQIPESKTTKEAK